MNLANSLAELAEQVGNRQNKGSVRVDGSTVNTPRQTLQSALDASREANISEVLERFADDLTFYDHALRLEFTDKVRLTEFYEKSRGLFPDTTLEIGSLFESGDHAIAGMSAFDDRKCVPRFHQPSRSNLVAGVDDHTCRERESCPMVGISRSKQLPITLAAFFADCAVEL